jgi:hypothetical protein
MIGGAQITVALQDFLVCRIGAAGAGYQRHADPATARVFQQDRCIANAHRRTMILTFDRCKHL